MSNYARHQDLEHYGEKFRTEMGYIAIALLVASDKERTYPMSAEDCMNYLKKCYEENLVVFTEKLEEERKNESAARSHRIEREERDSDEN